MGRFCLCRRGYMQWLAGAAAPASLRCITYMKSSVPQLTFATVTKSQSAVSVLHFLTTALSRLASPMSLKEMLPVMPSQAT